MIDIYRQILTDLKVEVSEEFDRNFTRKAFFDRAWPEVSRTNKRGSLLMRSGALRRGNRSAIVGNGIRFTNSMPYARIQNEGGVIVVTRKMQKFFWAMYYQLTGKVTGKSKKSYAISQEANYWKAMALKKVGSKIKIRERRFIGPHMQVDMAVRRVVDDNMREAEAFITSKLKR